MFSDAPNASWHPAMMPNSLADLPRNPPKDVPSSLTSAIFVHQDERSFAASDAGDEVHNKSIGPDAWFPDYGTGDSWIQDANEAPDAPAAISGRADSSGETEDEGVPKSSTASKHISTISFTRTVSHEVSWNDDDDPEWNLPRVGTDPFKFMPPNNRSNSFPAASASKRQEGGELELDEPLSHNQAEEVVLEAAREEARESFENSYNSFTEDDQEHSSNVNHQYIGGNLAGTTEALEARFEEGLPLISSTSDVVPNNDAGQGEKDFFGDDIAAEEDDFFSQVRNEKAAELSDEFPPALERKSTMQVLGTLDIGLPTPNGSPLHESGENGVAITEVSTNQAITENTPDADVVSKNDDDLKPADVEELAAKWQEMFAGDEEDELLLDDATETETKELDSAAFFDSDDEGFLDDSEIQPVAEPIVAPTTPSAADVRPLNGRYLPPSQLLGSAAPPVNPYIPAAASPALPPVPRNPYLPPTVAPAIHPLSASPFPTPSSVPPSTGYGYGAPPRPPLRETKAQSFVKATGGYTSPYDLPMDVVVPKKRASMHNLQRSTAPSASLQAPPAPPRSASLQSHPPPPTTPGSGLPHAGVIASSRLPPAANKPSLSDLRSKEHFFEELPMTTKPRPTSRQSNKSLPSPSLTSPYGAPLQPGAPPMNLQPATPQVQQSAAPFAAADIPKLVAPPLANPYASLSSNIGLSPAVPPTAPNRYSPAPPTNGSVPPPGPSRYSPALPSARLPSGGPPPAHPVTAPPILPHQPRTSSPLAHFEISHERSRSHAPSHHAESGPAERRSSSSMYDSRLQRVPSLPPTREVEEEEGLAPAQSAAPGYVPPPQPASPPESRFSQSPQRLRRTPPPTSFTGQSSLSPPKRATSSHSAAAGSHDFVPPPRSQTQSPGALYGNRDGRPVDPIPRPSSVHDSGFSRTTTYATAVPPLQTSAPLASASRPRSFSQNLSLVTPTDGRENDVLQRWRGAPLISWGVGGTIVTMFPKDVPRYGMNQSSPMILRSPGTVNVQNAKDLQPMEERLSKFPGPLKGKSKKKETISWLTTGIETLERGLPNSLVAQTHLSHDDKRAMERVLLWKILRLFIEHDGLLEGNPTIDKAVRDILTPDLETPGAPSLYTAGAGSRGFNDPVTNTMLSDDVDPSTVEQIRRHLLDGDCEKAVWMAVDMRLWGHALLLANALEPDLYKKVAQEFVKKEVNSPGHNNESLATLYEVLSGNHEESVDQLVPVHARAGLQLVVKDAALGTSKDAVEGLDKWRETLGLILGNRSADDSRAINSLGSLLSSYGRAEAAHICFMFARKHTVFGGLDDPKSDFVLVGSDHRKQAEQFAKEIEPLLLSEVYEYGQSLAGGSNVAVTNPHLAAYKLQHAFALAEYGMRDKALQYCEAISAAITAQTRRSPYHHIILEAAVEDLMIRLRQAPKEESNSWIPKPSMNKVSDSMWNRFNKFVAGDENDSSGPGSPKDNGESGPFARIAGGTPTISRPPSANNLDNFGAAIPSYPLSTPLPNIPVPMIASAPPTRAASRYAPGVAQSPAPYAPSSTYAPRSSMERTSSELNRSSSEIFRQSSDLQSGYSDPYSPNTTSSSTQNYTPFHSGGVGLPQDLPHTPISQPDKHEQSQQSNQPTSVASAYEPHGYSGPHVNGMASAANNQSSGADGQQAVSNGYQPPSYGYEPPSFTPYTAPVDKAAEVDTANNGSFEAPSFQPYGYEPPSYEPESQPTNDDGDSSEETKKTPKKKGIMYDDEDDFPVPRPAEKSKADKDRENAELFRKAAEEDTKRAAEAKQAKKGWGFTTWFGSGGAAKKESHDPASNKPIRAKLGEANSFYYDPDQKRWVNKNAGPEDNVTKKATAPPPRGGPRSASSSPAPPMGVPGPTSAPDTGRASAPPMGPPRSTMTPPPSGLNSSASEANLMAPPLAPPTMMRSSSNTSTGSGPPSRPTTSLSHSSSIDDLLGAAGPRKVGAKKPRKSARYVDVMTK
ncbi:Sec23-binding domain of Sec16-domain-containing protein [Lasiosphaeria miniovina]|uniref:Protein transport protein sec16 n=1 Tax=Lasiosphaeria miniovina TaxID=1954250 RepID=A0AA40E443_9PEZI|nr:Sec23-binding domain of Sec16-domain-containing protein [Lasiosphaeria miniovina]KAK0727354.1 Sec23-binding domain of Sec16-domain-containing protein [Lasiosphaeria miniovina]